MTRELDKTVVVNAEGGVNEVQAVKVDGTSGTFTLTYEGETTAKLAFNITPTLLAAALEDLSSVPEGAVSVSGGVGDSGGTKPYFVEFDGELAARNVDLIGDADELAGGGADVTVTVTTAGKDSEEALAVQRGTGLADRTEDVSPLEGASPSGHRAANAATYGD